MTRVAAKRRVALCEQRDAVTVLPRRIDGLQESGHSLLQDCSRLHRGPVNGTLAEVPHPMDVLACRGGSGDDDPRLKAVRNGASPMTVASDSVDPEKLGPGRGACADCVWHTRPRHGGTADCCEAPPGARRRSASRARPGLLGLVSERSCLSDRLVSHSPEDDRARLSLWRRLDASTDAAPAWERDQSTSFTRSKRNSPRPCPTARRRDSDRRASRYWSRRSRGRWRR